MVLQVDQRSAVHIVRNAFLAPRFWCRVLTFLVLMLATPGAAQVMEELASLAVGADCCGDPCEGGESESCSGTCGHCVCCAHISVLSAPLQLEPVGQRSYKLAVRWPGDGSYAAGYRAPPFRPPSA